MLHRREVYLHEIMHLKISVFWAAIKMVYLDIFFRDLPITCRIDAMLAREILNDTKHLSYDFWQISVLNYTNNFFSSFLQVGFLNLRIKK